MQRAAQTKSPKLQTEREDSGSESPLTELEDSEEQSPCPPKKRRRKARVVEPVVYDIPSVESKMTAFRGSVFESFHLPATDPDTLYQVG
jgi:hypothetical protein